jgi:DNA polymerase-1
MRLRMGQPNAPADIAARMLMQVHDELVFEAPDDEVEATIALVSKVMVEAPAPAVALGVPLAVEARAAANWDEAH